MKIKIFIAIVTSTIIIAIFLYNLVYKRYNTGEKDIISLLELPVTEDKISKMEIIIQSDNSINLVLNIDCKISIAKSSLFDIVKFEGSRLYNDIVSLINENGMIIEETAVKTYHVEYMIKRGLFHSDVVSRSVYIIIGNQNNTLVYTNIPEGFLLPHDLQSQQP